MLNDEITINWPRGGKAALMPVRIKQRHIQTHTQEKKIPKEQQLNVWGHIFKVKSTIQLFI